MIDGINLEVIIQLVYNYIWSSIPQNFEGKEMIILSHICISKVICHWVPTVYEMTIAPKGELKGKASTTCLMVVLLNFLAGKVA